MQKYDIVTIEEFEKWLNETTFRRSITKIQNHHTWIPNYSHFTGNNHLFRLQAMERFHIDSRGFSDIAQNITTFPDGKLAVCRSFEKSPAGITGQNIGALCIEHFGDFDIGGDEMTPEHRNTIIALNAILCRRFGLEPNVFTIVYHHWFDLKGNRLADNDPTWRKTCAGSNFFGGNKIADCEKHFIPLVKEYLAGNRNPIPQKNTSPEPQKLPVLRLGSKGDQVHTLQVKLAELGFSIGYADGVFGGLTEKAVRDFQTIYSLGTDGIVGEKTWTKLGEVKAKKGTVTASSLRVRAGAGVEFMQIDSLAHGEDVFIYAQNKNWYRISAKGWASADYIKLKGVE